jgi:hypothetical protein
LPELIGTISAQPSTNAYVSAVLVKVPPHTTKLLIHIVEKNVNAITYKVLGQSRASGTTEELLAPKAIAKAGSDWQTLEDAWLYVDVQIITTVNPNHGSVDVDILGI